jgi:glucan endo-1,3-alpha-glucosidase
MTSARPTATTTASPKYVVAHFIVGNTYPYVLSDWQNDVSLAYEAGFDGFALNIGRDFWEADRVADA